MTNAQAVILGAVQGLTEYLPISSSAHLVILPKVLGWHLVPKEAFIFNVLVQLGTLTGVVVYFFSPLKDVVKSVMKGLLQGKPLHNEQAQLGWLVFVASIPAACLGLMFKNEFSRYFSSPNFISYFLLVTGILLVLAEWLTEVIKTKPNHVDAVMIGCAQGLALFPGISRSGATIAAGMACGLSRRNAAYFSFLMSIPIMFGASLVASFDLIKDGELLQHMAMPLSLGFISAAIVGLLVIKWFMSFLTSRRLLWFAAYCLGLGFVGIYYLN